MKQKHLYSLRLGFAFWERVLRQPYGRSDFIKDLLAGLSVGVIAIPLAMALAIASGAPPQYGLYTAALAGVLVALTGGSRFSVAGPTAAFVVVLLPVAHAYGLAGLMSASLMAGAIMVVFAFFRLGRMVEYVPVPVTLGFTGGIAILIATLQVKDLLGLPIDALPSAYLAKWVVIISHLDAVHWPSLLVSAVTLGVMLFWPKLKLPVPAHLPAIILASVLAMIFNGFGAGIETIGSRFSYIDANGMLASGIPSDMLQFAFPWNLPGPDGTPLVWNWKALEVLLGAAFTMAVLASTESLLCAVVLDGMSRTRHSSNSELLGQGLSNMVAPFFGGFMATAALSRSAANVKMGAQSPISSVIHGLVVLLAVLVLADVLAYMPMCGMAVLLLIVAWTMSEAPKALALIKFSPKGDVWIFFLCLFLTVMFDMVIAITATVLVAMMLFVKDLAKLTEIKDYTNSFLLKRIRFVPPEGVRVVKINGPLFFAAADRIFSELLDTSDGYSKVVVNLEAVPVIDAGGQAYLRDLVVRFQEEGRQLIFCELPNRPHRHLVRSGMLERYASTLKYLPTFEDAMEFAANRQYTRFTPLPEANSGASGT